MAQRLIKHSVIAQGTGSAELETKHHCFGSRKTCFKPDSPSSAHPFYVLDNFIDVGLIDLNLLPGNKVSNGLSLGYFFGDFIWKKSSWMDQCFAQMKEIHQGEGQCVCQCIVLFSQVFLFGLRLVDLLCSPSIHLPLQLLFLSKAAGWGTKIDHGKTFKNVKMCQTVKSARQKIANIDYCVSLRCSLQPSRNTRLLPRH